MRTLKNLLVLSFLCVIPAFAALPAATVFEVRQAGNANNGGCFVTGSSGTDFSQQNGNQYTFTDLVLPTTTTGTSASHSFVGSDVGNCLHITAGTNCTVGFYQIVSVAAGTATFDRAAGTTGCVAGTYFVGGALALPTQPIPAIGNIIWMKADATYTTASQLNYAVADQVILAGYTSTRGDGGKATIQVTAGSISPVFNANNGSGNGNIIRNLIVDCNLQTSSGGIGGANGTKSFIDVSATNCKSTSINISGGDSSCIRCLVTGQSSGSSFLFGNQAGNVCLNCWVLSPTSGTGPAFTFGSGTCINCVGVGNASATTVDVFQFTSTGGMVVNSVCYNSGRDCFRFTALGDPSRVINSIAYTAIGFCFNSASGSTTDFVNPLSLSYNAVGNCTAGSYNNLSTPTTDVALSADPFANAGSNNFALNSTTGGGAAVKGVGYPGATGQVGTGFTSIGALPPTSSGRQVVYGGGR